MINYLVYLYFFVDLINIFVIIIEIEETNVEICQNSNDSIQLVFLYQIDKAIDSGNIIYIKNAIKDFGNLLDKSYIDWANSIALQIVEEKIDSMEI